MPSSRNENPEARVAIVAAACALALAGSALAASPEPVRVDLSSDPLSGVLRELRTLRIEILDLSIAVQQLVLANLDRELSSAQQSLDLNELAGLGVASELSALDTQFVADDLDESARRELESQRTRLLDSQSRLALEIRGARERAAELASRLADENQKTEALITRRSGVPSPIQDTSAEPNRPLPERSW